MTDIKDLLPKSDTLITTLKHPLTDEVLKNEDGSDMTIESYRHSTGVYKYAIRDVVNKNIKDAKDKGDIEDEPSEEATFLDSYHLTETSTIEIFVKNTKAWNITFGGEQPEFSYAKARELYSDALWIRDQIDEDQQKDVVFTEA